MCRNRGNGQKCLNLFQHLIESNSYQTLNQVQGDKKGVTTQPREGGGVIHGKKTARNAFDLDSCL